MTNKNKENQQESKQGVKLEDLPVDVKEEDNVKGGQSTLEWIVLSK